MPTITNGGILLLALSGVLWLAMAEIGRVRDGEDPRITEQLAGPCGLWQLAGVAQFIAAFVLVAIGTVGIN